MREKDCNTVGGTGSPSSSRRQRTICNTVSQSSQFKSSIQSLLLTFIPFISIYWYCTIRTRGVYLTRKEATVPYQSIEARLETSIHRAGRGSSLSALPPSPIQRARVTGPRARSAIPARCKCNLPLFLPSSLPCFSWFVLPFCLLPS
jgi:hypothetical protein